MYRILVTVKIRAQFCNMQRVTHRPRTSFWPICHCLLAYHFDEILLYTLCLHAIFLTKLQDFNCFGVFVYFLVCVCVCSGEQSMICVSFHIFLFFPWYELFSESADCKYSEEQMSSNATCSIH